MLRTYRISTVIRHCRFGALLGDVSKTPTRDIAGTSPPVWESFGCRLVFRGCQLPCHQTDARQGGSGAATRQGYLHLLATPCNHKVGFVVYLFFADWMD